MRIPRVLALRTQQASAWEVKGAPVRYGRAERETRSAFLGIPPVVLGHLVHPEVSERLR